MNTLKDFHTNTKGMSILYKIKSLGWALKYAWQRAWRIMGTVDKPNLSLTDAVKAATAAGMTYGQWVLHNRLESEQNGMD